MLDKDFIYKQIDNYFEIRKSLWTVIIVINGGLAGLLLSLGSFSVDFIGIIKLFLLILGSILDFFFITSIISINDKLTALFDKITIGD